MRFKTSSWNLEGLYSSTKSDEVKKDIQLLNELITRYSSLNHNEEFIKSVKLREELTYINNKLKGYANLLNKEDLDSKKYDKFKSRMQEINTRVENELVGFQNWWNNLTSKKSQKYLSKPALNTDTVHDLKRMRRNKKYSLSKKEEKILNVKEETSSEALVSLYNSVNNNFEWDLEIKGRRRRLDKNTIGRFIEDEKRKVRREVITAYHKKYKENASLLTRIYKNVVKDYYNENIKLRGFNEPISVTNFNNEISDEVMDTVLELCRSNTDLMSDNYDIRKELLGIEEFTTYDITAPLTRDENSIPYHEGVKLVLEAMNKFSTKHKSIAEEILKKEHVDSEVREDKRSTAFCTSKTSDTLPYILLNYNNTRRSVGTLAHELGHAIDHVLSSDHNIFTYKSNDLLSETAAVFNELVLYDSLISKEENDARKRVTLSNLVNEQLWITIGMGYYTSFEEKAHDIINNNEEVEKLQPLWKESMEELHDHYFTIPEGHKYSWVSVPHFYEDPFYCSNYVIAELLSLSLFNKYKKNKQEFVPAYEKMLKAGSSQYLEDILTQTGMNINKKRFWNKGFNRIEENLNKLE